MKKQTVIALIAAAVLIVAGGILLMLGLSYAGDPQDMLSHTEKTYVVKDSFHSIEVDVTTCDVTLVNTDGNFRAVCPDTETLSYTVTVEDGVLRVRQVDLRKWYDFIGIFQEDHKITLYLPQTQYDSLFVNTDTGDIFLPDPFTFAFANICTSTGDINCAAQITEDLTATASTGDIRVRDSAPESLTLSINTGTIRVQDVTCGACSVEADTGDVKLTGVVADTMQLQTDTGDITIENCDTESAEILSDTGDISGNFLTSKWFRASSDTGKVSVPPTREGGECYIETDTGDITFS